jgi:hypothetical protein
MNDNERDRILKMVGDGTLRPNEAAQLLAALAADEPNPAAKSEEPEADNAPKAPPVEIQMRRPDGSYYTIQVPPNLFAIFWQVAKVHLKEQARTAARETWQGTKNLARSRADAVRESIKRRVSVLDPEPEPVAPELAQQAEARRRILQMVQNGRLSAADASRLIEQLDAHTAYQKTHVARS